MPKAGPSSADHTDAVVAAGVTALGILMLATPDLLFSLMPPCLITLTTGEHCWGCGITHAIVHLVHGNFSNAWEANPRAFIVAPLLAWAYGQLLIRLAFTWWCRRKRPSACLLPEPNKLFLK